MNKYKTFKLEKRLFFILSIAAYFLPFIITAACLMPVIKAVEGFKIAIGLGVIVINAIPFLMGVFRWFFSHFPMLNMIAFLFLALEAFFRLEVFKTYADVFLWIELAAGAGSIISCVFWSLYLKYSDYNKTMKATLKSGAFILKGGNK